MGPPGKPKTRTKDRYKTSEISPRPTICLRSVNDALASPPPRYTLSTRQKWLPKNEKELSLRPFGYIGSEVVEAICKFCEVLGRENAKERQIVSLGFVAMARSKTKPRKKSSQCLVFDKFRRDHIKKHMVSEHATKWVEIQAITDDDVKNEFFLQKMIQSFLPSQPGFDFAVPSGIAGLIQRLFCNRDDITHGLVTVDADISEVVVADDFVETTDFELVTCIRDRDQFETVIRCISMGASCRGIAKLFVSFGMVQKNMKLGTPTRQLVGRYVRFVVALNLAAIRQLLNHTLGFAIMVDGATHKKEGYSDVRVSFGLCGKVHNFHLLAIPMGNATHTGTNYSELVLGILEDIGETNFLLKLVGI